MKELSQTTPFSMVLPSWLIYPLPGWVTLLAAPTIDGEALHQPLIPPHDPQFSYDLNVPNNEHGVVTGSAALVSAVQKQSWESMWGAMRKGSSTPRTKDSEGLV